VDVDTGREVQRMTWPVYAMLGLYAVSFLMVLIAYFLEKKDSGNSQE